MANYATLKAAIQAVIYENGNQEITGSVMQATLLAMVNSLGAGYQYAGIATPETDPGTPDARIYYIAFTAGTYVNFGGIIVNENEVVFLRYDSEWHKDSAGFATKQEVDLLSQKIGDFSQYDTEGYVPVSVNPVTGYYYSFANLAPTASAVNEYAQLSVNPGEKYKISGFNTNSSIPLAFVWNSLTNAKARAIYQSSGASMSGEYTIPEGYDTLFVNGRTATAPVSVEKWTVHPGSAKDAIDALANNKVDKIPGKGLSTNDFSNEEKAATDFVKDNIIKIEAAHGKNLINPAARISGYRVLIANGALYADSGYEYVEIDVSQLSNIIISSNVSLTSGVVVAKYNGDTFISGINSISTQDNTTGRRYASMDVSDATKVRMSLQTSIWNLRLIMIESGSTPTSYEPYYTITGEEFLDLASLPPVMKGIFGSGANASANQMVNNSLLEIPAGSVRKNQRIHFYAKIGTFDTIYVGKGLTEKGYLLVIDNTNIQFKAGEDGTGGSVVAHGLTIDTYIEVLITIKDNADIDVRIATLGGVYEHTFTRTWTNTRGNAIAKSIGSTLTECVLSWSSSDFRKPIWVFGDSYLGHYSEQRWPYYMIVAEKNDSCLLNAFPGENSTEALEEFLQLISYGAPRFIVWCLGMNDPDSGRINANWLYCVQRIVSYCTTHGVTPILATIPNVPSITHTYKNDWIRSSGYRYIDFAKAVNAESAGSTWIAGTLSSDNVHPTAEGAKLLCARALADVPEFLGQVM